MFWRRKKEGFVWQEYVRTTILVRRDQRRQRIEDIRDAAVDGLKQGARNGVALSAAGVRAAALALVHGLAAAFYAATDMMAAMAAATALWLADRSKQAAPALSAAIVRLVEATRVPALSVSLLFVGAVAAMAASAHWGAHGFDAKTLQFAGLACVALILAALPRLAALGNRIGGFIAALPGLSGSDRGNQTGTRPLTSALPAAVLTYGIPLALLAGLAVWIAPVLTASSTAPQSVLTANPVVTAASGRIEGRAVALTGGQLKVAGERVRLDGIEAPERGQTCAGPGKSQSLSCAAAAKSALARLSAGKQVACEVTGRADDGTVTASCQVNGADLAGQLVRGGHVFALTGLFAAYAGAEREAKTAKAGLWHTADMQRPAEYRAKVWADARLAAPEGCPIKGLISGEARSYILPWAASYDKARIRVNRGERWFCSETDARAAGWTAADEG